jgi:dUTP pyrophosphatase
MFSEAFANQPAIKFKRVRVGATIPERKTKHASGFDIGACFGELHQDFYPDLFGCKYSLDGFALLPNRVVMIPTGIATEISYGYELQVRPRSSLGKRGVIITNSPGTIDADYRGF